MLIHPGIAQAQSADETGIRQKISSYLNHTQTENISGLLDDLYPGVFAILPRDKMEAYFNQFFLDDEIRFRFESIDVQSVKEPFVVEARAFSRVDYHLDMTMHYLAAEKDSSVMDMLHQNLTSEFGEDRVIADRQAGKFHIQADKVMLVIRETPEAEWKVMDFDPSLLTFLEQMNIPKQVVEHFGL